MNKKHMAVFSIKVRNNACFVFINCKNIVFLKFCHCNRINKSKNTECYNYINDLHLML